MNTEQLAVSRRNSLRARAAGGAEHSARNSTVSTFERGQGRVAARLNRAIDLVGAILLAVVLAIPMLLIAVLIKISGRGPVLYWQERTGLNGRPFVLYKFRTMRVDAEERSGPVWARRGDPRRTWIGVLLRRSSLDELPQLINVLKGEMSLVGPRPERPFFVQSFSQQMPDYNRRHQVLPGITGWAQINGWRGDSSIEKRLECDLYYVDNWSVWLNLRILLLTPFKVLIERNAC